VQRAEGLGVEVVGEVVGVDLVEHARALAGFQDGGDALERAAHRRTEFRHHRLGDLAEQLLAGPPQQAHRAVGESRVLQAEVDEHLAEGFEPVHRRTAGAVDLFEPGVELAEVVDQGEREQLFLAGEVAIDQRLVDADPLGDVVDLGVDRAPLVEQLAGAADDVPLPVATALRRGPAASDREQRGAHAPILATPVPPGANDGYTRG
jgi:hypothetical protein